MSSPARSGDRLLRAAARMCGVATSYRDFEKNCVRTPDAALVRMINALQDHVRLSNPATPDQLRKLIDAMRQHRAICGLPPVMTAWEGGLQGWLWLQGDAKEIEATLTPEEGPAISWRQPVTGAWKRSRGKRLKLTPPQAIPFGYYTLDIHAAGKLEGSSFVVSAPRRLDDGDKAWGLFAPTYALTRDQAKPIGDFGDLAAAARLVKTQGGDFFGTLPLLAGNYEAGHTDVSPYSPVSRLFWNEVYLDLARLPGVEADAVEATGDDAAIVDYAAAYATKATAIARAADLFFTRHPGGDADYKAYERDNACLQPYAAFRAAQVPAGQRKKAEQFHRYAQYACHVQMQAIRDDAAAGRCAELYIDYPVGVDGGGFDARHFAHLFLDGFDVGAPPDMFFSQGQSWGFQPLHPRALEHDRFSYFRATIHHYFRYARMLRLDHAMGLYRLYCIPRGASAAEGAYVYYPFQALLAVLCLEAHRHQGVLIGEDLGTVPDAVERSLKAHNLNRMWIGQFAIEADPEATFKAVDPAMIASLNTHDMFPFAAFLADRDITELKRLHLINEKNATGIIKERSGLLRRWLKLDDPFLYSLDMMARSKARFVMVSVEDLWRETEPQNIPGTTDQYPNWRRRLAVPVEEWAARPDVTKALTILNRGRHGEDRTAR